MYTLNSSSTNQKCPEKKTKSGGKEKGNKNYPETKTPVPNRKINPIDAPRTSKSFPGLMAKRFGSGGLKPGGAVNSTAPASSLVFVDTETDSEGSPEALTITRVRIDLLREEETDRKIGG